MHHPLPPFATYSRPHPHLHPQAPCYLRSPPHPPFHPLPCPAAHPHSLHRTPGLLYQTIDGGGPQKSSAHQRPHPLHHHHLLFAAHPHKNPAVRTLRAQHSHLHPPARSHTYPMHAATPWWLPQQQRHSPPWHPTAVADEAAEFAPSFPMTTAAAAPAAFAPAAPAAAAG